MVEALRTVWIHYRTSSSDPSAWALVSHLYQSVRIGEGNDEIDLVHTFLNEQV